MKKNLSQEVIVLGMHRSGTSLVTGLIEQLGVNFGKQQLKATAYNPLGHHEDTEFLELNKDMLKKAGGNWSKPPSQKKMKEVGKTYASQIQKIIKQKKGAWGWKDPRTSLTLEAYIPYLKNPYIIICKRDPQQVAESLQRRSGTTKEFSYKLQRAYENRLEKILTTGKNKEIPRLEVNYDDVLKQTNQVVKQIVTFLELQPSQKQIRNAQNVVLSRKAVTSKRWKMLAKQALRKPWRIPFFLYDRLHKARRKFDSSKIKS